MGVRFYDKENMSTGDSCTTTKRANCNCTICIQLPSSVTTATTSTTATQTTNNLNNSNNLSFQKSGILREIVGNCKEMRIEDNIHNLRIVGNNNRIRITVNMGDITIIGNNTRLKIKINHGLIKYTGNDGCISLGKESTEQLVDYSGCNGVLKVQNSRKSSQVNAQDTAGDDELKNKTTMGNTNFSENSKKGKYGSFSGSPSASEMFNCHNTFKRKKSMPNITTKPFQFKNESSEPHHSPKAIVHNFGNIVISNSSNVCISPYTHTY